MNNLERKIRTEITNLNTNEPTFYLMSRTNEARHIK